MSSGFNFSIFGFSKEDEDIINRVSDQIQLMADLTNSDIFIDCMLPDENAAIVVAQAQPTSGTSLYQKNITGQQALPENEPAVFHTFTSNMPVRDLKAITQENRTVKQDVVPICGSDGKVIALLISEKDISNDILLNKKYEELGKRCEEDSNMLFTIDEASLISMRAMHHWVKNSLQLVASRLNMESRMCGNQVAQKILNENVSRILSIAATHDILTRKPDVSARLSSKMLFKKLCENMLKLAPENKEIELTESGDDILLSADSATTISVIITELIINALKYAFEGKDKGSVSVVGKLGNMYNTITVIDNGVGFDPFANRLSASGLEIVSLLVREKLKGELHISSGEEGTRVIFDFKK